MVVFTILKKEILCLSTWKTYEIYLAFDKKKYIELLIISKYKYCDF